MALQTKPGAILRHGTANLRPEQVEFLIKNKKEVEKILTNIEERREAFLKAMADANAATKAAESAEAELAGTLEKTERAQAKLDADKIKAKQNGDAEREALGRRAREVIRNELACSEREAAVEAREKDLDAQLLKHREEMRDRQDAIEAQEAAFEETLQKAKARTADLDRRENLLLANVEAAKKAAAKLG